MKRMTTREAIALCRAQAMKESGPIREALETCAAVAEHHADRNRKNKRRQRERAAWRGDLCHEG